MRDENSIIMPSNMTCAEFEYLQNLKWECTEKIDGTNIHCDIFCDGETVQINICGRTEKANIPSHLLAKLQSIFTIHHIGTVFDKQIQAATPETPPSRLPSMARDMGLKFKKVVITLKMESVSSCLM